MTSCDRAIWSVELGPHIRHRFPDDPRPRVLKEIEVDWSSGSDKKCPDEIYRLCDENKDYVVCWRSIYKPARKLSEESKQKIRRNNMEKRVRKSLPLFADDVIAKNYAENPEYFGVKKNEQ